MTKTGARTEVLKNSPAAHCLSFVSTLAAVLTLIFALVTLTGCQTNRALSPDQRKALKTPDSAFAKYDLDAEQLRATLSNKTALFYDPAQGTRVAYYNASGKEFLWYPFNKRVVKGEWKTETAASRQLTVATARGKRSRTVKSAEICFLYKKGKYNPVTGKRGGTWRCSNSLTWLRQMQDTGEGDLFNLSSGKVPFRLNKRKTTLAELKSQCKSCKTVPKSQPLEAKLKPAAKQN